MENIAYRYIMVSHYEDHWDKLKDETNYPFSMLRGQTTVNLLQENIPATFVKLSAITKKPEGAWQGKIFDIRKTGTHVYFKVKIETVLPNVEPFAKLKEGWYIKPLEDESTNSDTYAAQGSNLQPPIFDTLLSTQSWEEFEDYAYYLIRLLGVHTVYAFPREKQSGRADGFFKFSNLAVIYDCTLEDRYEERKKSQIRNYCNEMKGGVIEVADNAIEEFHNHQKQVWLVTRGRSRPIQRVNDIAVKEVHIRDLIDIYENRLRNMIGEGELENALRNVASTQG